MILGPKDFDIVCGDLVKVVRSEGRSIPLGTIAVVVKCRKQDRSFILAGYHNEYLSAAELEIVSYARQHEVECPVQRGADDSACRGRAKLLMS